MRLLDATTAAFEDDPRFAGTVSGVHLTPSSDPELHAYVVHFEPGGRTAWHAHERGQLLVCIAGSGVVGARDGARLELRPGAAVWTEPGEEHWHGATTTDPMSHVAIQTETPGIDSVVWREPVTETSPR